MGSRLGTNRAARLSSSLLVFVLALLPAPAAAQQPVKSFDELNTRLKPGDTVWVTDVRGLELTGKIASLGPDAIVVNAGGPRTFQAGEVRLVQDRERDSLLNGTLIGMGVGLGVGAGLAALICREEQCDARSVSTGLLVYSGIGAAAGVLIDSGIPGRKRVVFRPSGTAAGARLSIAPVITPRAKGVALSFAF